MARDSHTTASYIEGRGDISRRRLLALASAGAAGAIAGCGGQDGEATPGDDTGDGGSEGSDGSDSDGTQAADGSEGGSQPVEGSVVHPTGELINESDYNDFAGQAYNYTNAQMLFDQTAKTHSDGTIEYMVLDSFDIDDDNVETWSFREDWKWWNGDDFTAEDWYVAMKIAKHFDGESSPFEEIRLADDYTIKAQRKNVINTSLRRQQIADQDMFCYREVYRPWLEKLEEATTDDEVQQIQKDLQETSVTHTDLMENGWGNGPYEITKVENQRLVLEPFEDHPWADDANVQQFEFVYSEDAGRRQKIINDEYDLQTQVLFPNNLEGQAPDYLENITKYGAEWSWGLKLNWSNKDALQEAGVRRAMLAALSLPDIVTNNDGNGMPVETQTGMSPGFSERWLGEDALDEYIQYPVEQDYERADEFLERAGYSRQGGEVVDPDGNVVELEFIAQSSSPRSPVAQSASGQLQNYGFKINFQGLSRNQFVNTYYDNMDRWDLCVESHYGGSYNHPLAYYNVDHMFGMIHVHYEDGQEQIQNWIDEGTEYSPYNGKPLNPTLPAEKGSLDLGDGGENLNLYESNVVLTESLDEDRTAEMVEKLATYWNFHLPDIDLIQRENGSWGDTKNFEWPSGDTPEMTVSRGPFHAIKKGMVDHVYE